MNLNKNEILNYMKKLGADIVGIAEYNDTTKKLLTKEGMREKGNYKSIIIAGRHIADPYLDMWSYFEGMRPLSPADDFLAHIILQACMKLEREGFHTTPLLYSSMYLKDAACHAKLGVIGRNNLLVTPEFGPQVRLLAFLTEAELLFDEKTLDNPCDDCDAPCLKACPVNAFKSGQYDKDTCYSYASNNLKKISTHTFLWCRECELACPAGNFNN
jgi:epoxyqueuosine reductase